MANPVDVAWAAGLFEGEGHIGKAGLTVLSTDEDVMQRFFSIVEVGTLWKSSGRTKGGKESWRWRCRQKADVLKVRKMFDPFFSEHRQRQAAVQDEFFSSQQDRKPRARATCPNCGYTTQVNSMKQHRKRCDQETMERTPCDR